MSLRLFFYGTLMAGFDRRRTAGVEASLRYLGRGSISARLYDLGPYPAAVAGGGTRVWGELYETDAQELILPLLDEIEGYLPADPGSSLYVRRLVEVSLPEGAAAEAWVYFYNGPTDGRQTIPSGDYLVHLTR